jgi:hypothetical protein
MSIQAPRAVDFNAIGKEVNLNRCSFRVKAVVP